MSVEQGITSQSYVVRAGLVLAGASLLVSGLAGCGTSKDKHVYDPSLHQPTAESSASLTPRPTDTINPDENYQEQTGDEDDQTVTDGTELTPRQEASKEASVAAADLFRSTCRSMVKAAKSKKSSVKGVRTNASLIRPKLTDTYDGDSPTGGPIVYRRVAMDNVVMAAFSSAGRGDTLDVDDCTAVSFVDGIGTGQVGNFLKGKASAAKKMAEVTIYSDLESQEQGTDASSYDEPEFLVVNVHNGSKDYKRMSLTDVRRQDKDIHLGDRGGNDAISEARATDVQRAIASAANIVSGY